MTTRLLTAYLLLLSCLLSRPATSQPVQPLAPTVVRLAAGDVVRGPLVGLDTATYTRTRQYVAAAGQLLLVRADRISQLERATHLADSLSTVASSELRRCRQQAQANEAEFQQLAALARKQAEKPPAAPFLLDPHTWKGAGLGAVAVVLLKVFILH